MVVDLDVSLDDLTKKGKKGGSKGGKKQGEKKEAKTSSPVKEKKTAPTEKTEAPLPSNAMDMSLDDVVKTEKDARIAAAKSKREAEQKKRQAEQRKKQQQQPSRPQWGQSSQKGSWGKGSSKGGGKGKGGKGSNWTTQSSAPRKNHPWGGYQDDGTQWENRDTRHEPYQPKTSSKGAGKGSGGSYPEGVRPGSSIEIRNCPPGVKGNDLKEAFEAAGEVTWVSDVDQRNKIAYITFRNPKMAHEAEFQFDGGEINGKKIGIKVVKRDA